LLFLKGGDLKKKGRKKREESFKGVHDMVDWGTETLMRNYCKGRKNKRGGGQVRWVRAGRTAHARKKHRASANAIRD